MHAFGASPSNAGRARRHSGTPTALLDQACIFKTIRPRWLAVCPRSIVHTQAFVVFESPEEAQRACQKDRETFGDKFGDRYVRVYPTLESDIPDMQLAFQQQHMVAQVRNRQL